MDIRKLRRIVKPSLESLDERIAPAGFMAGHVHAAVAGRVHAHVMHHRVAHHRGLAFRAGAAHHQAGASAAQAGAADASAAASASGSQATPAPLADSSSAGVNFVPTSTNPGDVQNGPLAKAGQGLIQVYLDYQKFVQNGGTGTFQSSESGLIRIQGTDVGVDIQVAGDFNAGIVELTNAGMQITATDPNTRTVEGFVHISSLPTLVNDPVVGTIAPSYLPNNNPGGGPFSPR